MRTEKKRLVRALAEKAFSNREWPVMNWTVCGRYATIKLAYANWWHRDDFVPYRMEVFFYVLAEWQVYAGRDGYVGY